MNNNQLNTATEPRSLDRAAYLALGMMVLLPLLGFWLYRQGYDLNAKL